MNDPSPKLTRLAGAIIFFIACIVNSTLLYADRIYAVDAKQSVIQGAVKYAVIGTYRARFTDCSGTVYFDRRHVQKSSVILTIQIASIQSRFAVLDKIARSQRVLNAVLYPEAHFQSTRIEKQGKGYRATGILTLHGVKREITFPCHLELSSQNKILTAHGRWVIRRKGFNIIWDKMLDRGGLVIGDDVVLNWKIVAVKN